MTTPPPTPENERRVSGSSSSRLPGLLFMTAGGMVALLCGLCTFALGSRGLGQLIRLYRHPVHEFGPAHYYPDVTGAIAALLVPLLVGGVPTAAGVVVFVVGLKMFRR